MFAPTHIDTSKMIVSIEEKEKHLLLTLLERHQDKLKDIQKSCPERPFIGQMLADNETLLNKLHSA